MLTNETQPGDDQGFLLPPADTPEIRRGSWCSLPQDDPVAAYLAKEHLEKMLEPPAWEVARLSSAAYVYRERNSGSAAVAKFYAVKTSRSADKYAHREFRVTQEAQSICHKGGEFRAVRPLSVWRGVLFVEHIDGLTLEDVIAVRRSRPGTLLPSIERIARFLAHLHANGIRADEPVHFDWEINDTRDILDDLSNHGVIEDNPVIQSGLKTLIDRWADSTEMRSYTSVLNHGDATTSNFIFPWQGEMVTIDWERARPGDPAADLGRLMAELSHSLKQHGGSIAEAMPFIEHLQASYRQALPAGRDVAALLARSRFYMAASTLRIARNGWVSRLDRTALVAQALAWLSE
ncbi:MAG TPA: aminoglycoside phosphotransferase family protein [Anaerolineales bacterium]|jgi:thiamine kinase-like enzyme|nr:aminoglycoside phosphotransferase family protein [Anaerolineales bacterium]